MSVRAPNVSIPGNEIEGVREINFSGPHPAGLAGTHIHLVDPVSATKTVWSIGYQDVIAIGHLFTTGSIDTRQSDLSCRATSDSTKVTVNATWRKRQSTGHW